VPALSNAPHFADVEVVINAFNLPKANDKSTPITEENLGVVVVKELEGDANKVVLAQVFTGPTVKLLLRGVGKNDVLSFGFVRNSPKDPTVTDTTQVVKGMVVTGESMTLDVVVPVPKKPTAICPQEVPSCNQIVPCRPANHCRVFGMFRCK